MQFMMIVKASSGCEAGKKPSGEVIAAIGNYTQELRRAGALVELSRLHPSSKGARVKLSRGSQSVTDGPFAETKELIGGYWIIEAKSLMEAIEWAKRVPAPAEETEIEIRQFLELEEFTPSKTVDRAAELEKEIAKTKKQSL
jgi:hypothetical protein